MKSVSMWYYKWPLVITVPSCIPPTLFATESSRSISL